MITLDSSSAWASARRMVAANREMLAAIAGVFFLLPGLIAVIAMPVPPSMKGMTQEQMADAITRFYTQTNAGAIMLALTLPVMVGYLTMLGVMLDRARPTVGGAIVQALRLLPGFLGAHILTSLAISFAWVVLAGVLMLALPALIAVPVASAVMVYPLARVVLTAPAMVVGRIVNPIRAIGASLRATRRQAGALVLFFGPAITLFLVVYLLAAIVVDLALAQLGVPAGAQGPDDWRAILAEAVMGVLFAAAYTYFTAMIAASWNQLADREAPIRE